VALIFPGDRLLGRMAPDAVTQLGQDLRGMIVDLETEHSPLFKAVAVWWKWYEATPRDKEKSFPFVGASNVVVPLIGIVCDALTSRAVAQATAAAPQYWVCESENEDNAGMARNMQRYLNWQANGNCFSLKHVLADMFLETFVVGRGACAVHYRHDERPFFHGRTAGSRAGLARRPIMVQRGPLVEHVPTEHLLWDRRHRIGDAPVVVRRHEYQWAELRDMAQLDPAWDAEAVREVQKWPGIEDGTDTSAVRRVKADLDLRDEGGLSLQPHDVREVWVDWSMLGNQFEVPGDEEWGGQQVPLLVHLHMQSGKVLRLVGSPYLLPYKPFVDFRFRAGRGVAKRMEMIQRIETSVVNQELDAGTRRNAFWGMTRNATLQRQPMDPSRLMLVSAMDEVAPFAMPNYTASNLNLMVAMNTMAERWMGHSDPLLGRDTRSGGHPAPATSTLALLDQVGVMSSGTDVVIQEELSRLGQCIAMLDQQFEDNQEGRLERILGKADAAKVSEYLFPDDPLPGNYSFSVAAMSRNQNPDTLMRQTLMVAQAYQNYGALAAQGIMIIANPQAPAEVKAVWTRLLDGYGQLLERFLDAANVDDTERFLIQLGELGIDAKNALGQFRQQAAAAASGGAGAPGAAGPAGAAGGPGGGPVPGGMGGAANGAGGGAGSPFTGGGLLQ
jgi:hypothetical protein